MCWKYGSRSMQLSSYSLPICVMGVLKFRPGGGGHAHIQTLWGMLKFRLSGVCSDTVEECSNSEPVGHTQIQTQWGMLRHSGGILKFRTCGAYSNSDTAKECSNSDLVGACSNSDSVGHAQTQWRNAQIQTQRRNAQIQNLWGMFKFRPCSACSNSDPAGYAQIQRPCGVRSNSDPVEHA